MYKSFKEAAVCLSIVLFDSMASAQSLYPPPSLKSLDVVLSELRAEQDFTKASYFFKRCSGYSFATSKLLVSAGGDRHKEQSVEWHKYGMNLIDYAADTEMAIQKSRSPGSKKTKEQWTQETADVAIEFANMYLDRMSANYMRSGNYVFDDPWLKAEHEICQDAQKRVMEALR